MIDDENTSFWIPTYHHHVRGLPSLPRLTPERLRRQLLITGFIYYLVAMTGKPYTSWFALVEIAKKMNMND